MGARYDQRPWTDDDLQRLRVLFEGGLADKEIAERLGRSYKATKARRHRHGVFRPSGVPRRPMPEDFREVAPGKTSEVLCAHYRASERLITRWRKDCGIDARTPPPPRERKPMPPKQPKAKKGAYKFNYTGPKAPQPEADGSRAGRAADYLRSPPGGGWPVYRCTDEGRAAPDGSCFRVGRMVLTQPDMVAMAERKGFKPDAWMVAA